MFFSLPFIVHSAKGPECLFHPFQAIKKNSVGGWLSVCDDSAN